MLYANFHISRWGQPNPSNTFDILRLFFDTCALECLAKLTASGVMESEHWQRIVARTCVNARQLVVRDGVEGFLEFLEPPEPPSGSEPGTDRADPFSNLQDLFLERTMIDLPPCWQEVTTVGQIFDILRERKARGRSIQTLDINNCARQDPEWWELEKVRRTMVFTI
ncbi:hypothetical protein EVG20_g8198 [Dentipellis fragilis]|uniref:Uncharacterized protein n=1 Tax=Dentipellis fragilis TaxID=205917 RepID=A0A4Y9Y721_9AGAM|nr:hypothetical protein EVG20_g8198 [Dentipellis fragilis]